MPSFVSSAHKNDQRNGHQDNGSGDNRREVGFEWERTAKNRRLIVSKHSGKHGVDERSRKHYSA